MIKNAGLRENSGRKDHAALNEDISLINDKGLRENQGTIENTSQSKIISSVESPADFEKVWLPLPEGKELIEDHVTFRVKAIELRKNEKVFNST